MPPATGIVHAAGKPGQHVYLPLEELRAEVFIIDVAARVTLTQTFTNDSDHSTSKAVYYFPVPAGAAVCAFAVSFGDGRVIRAVCKENKQAREEFEAAVLQGKHASLLEWVADDVFTISIGSIPAKETIRTRLVYAMNLLNQDVDEVRLQLPSYVGERYGTRPQQLEGASTTDSSTRVRITVDVQTSGTIRSIFSPTHGESLTITPYSTHLKHPHLNRPSRRRSTVKYRSKEYLSSDFVLIVHADSLDAPRCFGELEGNPARKATLAVQLTLIPKWNLPPIQNQEYIFVIDRSGSMQDGGRIDQAKRTLNMLIRMLPTDRATFNIFSFGHEVDGMWAKSVAYTQSTLDTATTQIEAMSANYGGTKILRALETAIASRNGTTPTAMFILTDGEVWDDAEMANNIINSVQALASSSPLSPSPSRLKIHVLGIGSGVSTQMCQDIARAGNGVCLFATEAEDILGSCIKLLVAGRTPHIKDISIDWGIPPEELFSHTSTVSFSPAQTPDSESQPSTRTVRIRPLPKLQQAPTRVEGAIHAGTRLVVYAILRLKKVAVPKQVILRGRLDSSSVSSSLFEIVVPLRGVQLKDSFSSSSSSTFTSLPTLPSLIHIMAARALINEHEHNRAPLPIPLLPTPPDLLPPDEQQLRRAAIVRLGEKYQLATRYTSFIASDGRGRAIKDQLNFGNWDTPNIDTLGLGLDIPLREDDAITSGQEAGLDTSDPELVDDAGPADEEWVDVEKEAAAVLSPSAKVPGAWPPLASITSQTTTRRSRDADEGYESDRTFTTMSSLESCSSDWSGSEWSVWEEPPPPELSEEDARLSQCASPLMVPLRLAPEGVRRQRQQQQRSQPAPLTSQNPTSRQPIGREIFDIAVLQLHDGSYSLMEPKLRKVVGGAAIDEFSRITPSVVANVWATALAVAFITKHLVHRKELSNDITLKSRDFLKAKVSVAVVDEMLRRARGVVI